MTNVVSIGNSARGFTRMDNELYEALISADLSGRELRVALAVHRLTAGYNVETARIPAATIAQMANLRREHVSRMISELIRQRVLYRAGGSQGDGLDFLRCQAVCQLDAPAGEFDVVGHGGVFRGKASQMPLVRRASSEAVRCASARSRTHCWPRRATSEPGRHQCRTWSLPPASPG